MPRRDYVTVEEKYCPRCKLIKPAEEFPKNRARYDGLGAYCKSCSQVMQADWYDRNRAAHIENTSARKARIRKENRAKILEYLATHVCEVCGEPDAVVLEFHHKDEGKESAISQMVNDALPWERIERELDKCAVLCANDHRRVTAKARRWYRAAEQWRAR